MMLLALFFVVVLWANIRAECTNERCNGAHSSTSTTNAQCQSCAVSAALCISADGVKSDDNLL